MDGTDSQLGANLVAAINFLSRQGQIPPAVNKPKLQGKSTKFLTDPFRTIDIRLNIITKDTKQNMKIAMFNIVRKKMLLFSISFCDCMLIDISAIVSEIDFKKSLLRILHPFHSRFVLKATSFEARC